MTTPEVIRSFVYAHVARSNMRAIERQVRECRALAESLSSPGAEYRIVRVFQDDGGSGLSADRPAYRELLAALEQGEASTVLVFSAGHLHRSEALKAAYGELSSRLGITTHSAQSGPAYRGYPLDADRLDRTDEEPGAVIRATPRSARVERTAEAVSSDGALAEHIPEPASRDVENSAMADFGDENS